MEVTFQTGSTAKRQAEAAAGKDELWLRCRVQACMHVYIHTYIHTHTHIHTYIHTYIQLYEHSRLRAQGR